MKELFLIFAPYILVAFNTVIWIITFYFYNKVNLNTIIITHIVSQLWLFLFWAIIIRELHQQANKDSLTGVYNRRCFFSKMPAIIKMMLPVSLMMIDVDNFKRINDTYGHSAGDEVLAQFAEILRNNARKADIIVRLGGEEFAVILPLTCKESAVRIAERIKQAVEKETFKLDYVNEKITVSIGTVTTNFPMKTDMF